MQWLRRSFITGLFVTVPLFISVAAFIWIFNVVDGLTSPLFARLLERRIPGLGIVTTAVAIMLVGAFATNVIGKRVLQRAEGWLLRLPVFRTIYAPVKQIVVAFSPENESGFKRVVLIDDSIVRGTTARKIVKMVRGAGAREVHLRISSPPTTGPCDYGIDTPLKSELIAASHGTDEIRRFIGADSLAYLSQQGLLRAVGDAEGERHCTSCFSGQYPVAVPKPEDWQLRLFEKVRG